MATPTEAAKLSITPLTPDTIPSRESLLAAARALFPGTGAPAGWQKGKAFQHGSVQALYRKIDGAGWHARLSAHSAEECSFDEFWAGLGRDKAVNEAQYMPEINEAVQLRDLGEGNSIWSLHYVFPAPLQPRVFTVLQAVFRDSAEADEFFLVQLPVDVSADAELAAKDHGLRDTRIVRGRYASVERLCKTADGKTEWLMATSSAAGGNIPQFVQEMSIPGQIAHDVPRFLSWVQDRRKTDPLVKTDAEAAPPA